MCVEAAQLCEKCYGVKQYGSRKKEKKHDVIYFFGGAKAHTHTSKHINRLKT